MRFRTYRKLQALLMGALAFYLLERFWAGQLMLYINPRYQWLVVLTAFGLMALAIIAFNHQPPIWEEEDGLLSKRMAPDGAHWRLIILVVPLLFGVLIPARPLDSTAAEQRGMSQSLPLAGGGSAPLALELEPGNRTILQWLWAFESVDDTDSLVGQPADVQGFVFNTSELPNDFFMVGRFIVSCCVADAVVLGLPVMPPENEPVPDGWVQVKGEVQISSIGGKEQLIIQATQLLSIEPPAQPYLYP